jgi:DNA-binding response OmpR family regulator
MLILVVEQGGPHVRLLTWGLQEEGYEVLAAADFSHWDEKDAVLRDVLVFNSHMTPASYVLWVKAIRALVPGVKVVDLATSVGSPPQSTGADAYVYPPHRVEELVAAIARITGVSPPPKGTPSEYPQHPG